MIRINKKRNERTGAIATSSIKENHRDEKDGKSIDTPVKQTQKSSTGFSFFERKSSIEELKKKVGPAISAPITADANAVQDFRESSIERYAVREPVLYISIARDEIGSLLYMIEEPVLTEEETLIYSNLMDVL